MYDNRYDIKWIGHCSFDDSDKIWGWFIYNDPTVTLNSNRPVYAYVFWARTGKTLSFKKHSYSDYTMRKLQKKKEERSYHEINKSQLVQMWPSLYEDLNNKFIFHILANDL
jgi:hypothetical protein